MISFSLDVEKPSISLIYSETHIYMEHYASRTSGTGRVPVITKKRQGDIGNGSVGWYAVAFLSTKKQNITMSLIIIVASVVPY